MTLLPSRGWFRLITTLALLVPLARPGSASAQTATLTDDAYSATNPALQLANAGGLGPAVVVAGPIAVVAGRTVGTANGYLRFRLTSDLPEGTTEADVARATLKLYVSILQAPSAVTVCRVNGAWTESTLAPGTLLTLTPQVTGIPVSKVQSFLTIDVTPVVKDWISGRQPNQGLALVAATDGSFVSFDSKESPLTGHEPTLEITLFGHGSAGTPGPTGPQGPAGPGGPQGPAGPAGATGAQGTAGPAGAIGPQGPIGLTGLTGATGATGPEGPAGRAGPKGLNWRGAWDATVDYVLDDAVSFDGSSWRALRASTGLPPVEGDDWALVARKGDDGEDGSVSGGVSSVSAASPLSVTNPTTTPAIALGVVPAANGGTGLSAPGAAGAFLRSSGTGWMSTPLLAPDLPAGSGQYIQNGGTVQTPGQFNIVGTGTAAVFDAGTQFNIGGNRILWNGGVDNVFVGANAGANNTTATNAGFWNTFVGSTAGQSNVLGVGNTYIGAGAGLNGVNSAANTYVGNAAGSSNTDGSLNTFVGNGAGFHNTIGFRNAFFGRSTGFSNTEGNENAFYGTGAGFGTTTGDNNAFLGDKAGNDNTTGSNNVFLGHESGNSNLSTQVDNSVAIGSGVKVSTSNTIVLGTSAQTTRIPGQVQITGQFQENTGGTVSYASPFGHLVINNLVVRRLFSNDIAPSPAPVCVRLFSNGIDGGAGFTQCTTSSSSIRYKKDLEPYTGGLDVVSRLKPTRFTWKASNEPEIGLIAEQVAEVEPLFTYNNADGQIEGIKYPNMSVIFVNAIKEQQQQLADLREQLRQAETRAARQQDELDALKALVAKPSAGATQASGAR
jgi:hypothetical protein